MRNKLKRICNNQGFNKYLKNTSWLFLDKAIKIVIELVVVVWLARYLGPDQFGLFNYIISIVFLFTVMSSLGLDGIVVREIIKKPEVKDEILGTAFLLKLTGGLVAVLSLAGVSFFLNESSQTKFLIFIASLTLPLKAMGVLDFYFQANVLMKFTALSNIITNILAALIKVLLIIYQAPLDFFIFVYLAEVAILMVSFLVFYVNSKGCFLSWKLNKGMALQFFKDAWPLIFSTLMISMYMRIDQVMLRNMLDSYSVGQYVVATRLAEAWYFIPAIITTSLFPAIISARELPSLYSKRIQSLYDLLISISVLVALPVSLFSNQIIYILYGGAYAEAGSVLAIYIWASLFVSINAVRGKWQIAENLTKMHLIGAIVTGLANILLNLILIPMYGVTGAAIASFISLLFAAYGLNYMFKELHGQLKFIHNSLSIKRLLRGVKRYRVGAFK